VPEGDSTVEVANALIDWSLARGEPIVASQDWHPADHGSFASQHQVEPYTEGELDGLAQTSGRITACSTAKARRCIPLLKQQAIAAVFHKGQNRIIDSYSAFFDNGHRQKTELDGWLRGQGIVELTVLGLATDYCVKFTVLDALALGYSVNVITDGCRGVNLQPQDSSQAFMEMAAAGATLYTLDDWRETQA
ncbi:nicotinamidase/pyrazinamidase, partial [Klebsiella pneumoniae]